MAIRSTLINKATYDPDRKKLLEVKWAVKMGVEERMYLEEESMYLGEERGARRMICDNRLEASFKARSRRREREEECFRQCWDKFQWDGQTKVFRGCLESGLLTNVFL